MKLTSLRLHLFREAPDRFFLFPLLTPVVLLLTGGEGFGFDAPGYIDPFLYLGHFWHYLEHLPQFERDYKISRLPWVLPGAIAHALGGVVGGTYILVYITMTAAAVALYVLIRDTLRDRATAAIVAVAWTCCAQGHGVGGWNYHILATGAYYLAACWFVVRAATGPFPGRAAFAAGASFAAVVHTYLFMIVFAPLLVLLYVIALPKTPPPPRMHGGWQAGRLVAGGLALTVMLAAFNRATGGEWLFFMPQIAFTLFLGQTGDVNWVGNPFMWLRNATYLVFPVLFLIAGVIGLPGSVMPASAGPPRSRMRVALIAQAWIAFAILCFFQFVLRKTMLDHDYFAFVAYFSAFPCVAAALGGTEQSKGRRVLPATVTLAAVGMLLTPVLGLPTALPLAMRNVSAAAGLASLPPIGPPLVFGILGVVVTMLLHGPARLLTFAVWFAVVNAWIAPSPTDYGIGTPSAERQMVVLFREADRLTSDIDPTLSGIKYWFPEEQITTPTGVIRLNWVFDSFISTRGWSASLLSENPAMPIDQLSVGHLQKATCVGLFSSTERHDELRQELSEHFERLGHPLNEVASRRFERPSISFALTVLKPRSRTETLPPCWPL